MAILSLWSGESGFWADYLDFLEGMKKYGRGKKKNIFAPDSWELFSF